MGMVFGKVGVAEPAHEILLTRGDPAETKYEVRRYGNRFAIETEYPRGEEKGDETAFKLLAGYIGVLSKPQNEGSKKIAMTAPVVMENSHEDKDNSETNEGTKIQMTAPVAMSGGNSTTKKMQFILPEELDDMSKIPKPTNPKVKVAELPPAVGAVHKFSGFYTEENSRPVAEKLIEQLQKDGSSLDTKEALNNFQFWPYNPPFTIPALRRNEIWIELTQAQADDLVNKFASKSTS